MQSDKVQLAQRILDAISQGYAVSFDDAIHLRNAAATPEEAMLPLEEIAKRILNRAEKAGAAG